MDHLIAQIDPTSVKARWMSPKWCVWYLKYWWAQVTPQLMQKFNFIGMIFVTDCQSLSLSWFVGVANGQKKLTNRVFQPLHASATLRECDPSFFPNINVLLRILCSLPVTSLECERSFTTKKRKTTTYVETPVLTTWFVARLHGFT